MNSLRLAQLLFSNGINRVRLVLERPTGSNVQIADGRESASLQINPLPHPASSGECVASTPRLFMLMLSCTVDGRERTNKYANGYSDTNAYGHVS